MEEAAAAVPVAASTGAAAASASAAAPNADGATEEKPRVFTKVAILAVCLAIPVIIMGCTEDEAVTLAAMVVGGLVLSFLFLFIVGWTWTYCTRRLRVKLFGLSDESDAVHTERMRVDALQALPTRVLHDDAGDDCTLCLEPLARGASVRVLACSHKFHTECIDAWFASAAMVERPRTCPICKADPLVDKRAPIRVLAIEVLPDEPQREAPFEVDGEEGGEDEEVGRTAGSRQHEHEHRTGPCVRTLATE